MGAIIHKHTLTCNILSQYVPLPDSLLLPRCCHSHKSKKSKTHKASLPARWQRSTQSWGKWGDGGHFLLICKQRESGTRQKVSLTESQRKGDALSDREEKRHKCKREQGRSRGIGWVTVVPHPLPQWHRTQSNAPHSWPCIRLASRDLVSLPQLNAHPHIINDCFVHRSIKGLFIKSPFASSKIPLLSSLLHLRRWQCLAEFPFWFHVCGFSLFFFSCCKIDDEVKERVEVCRMWEQLLEQREMTYGKLLVWMYESQHPALLGCLSYVITQR